MKKHGWTVLAVAFILGLFMVTANAQAIDEEALKAEIKEELKEELKGDKGPLAGVWDNITFSGLVEVEAAFEDGFQEDSSDIVLATVELGLDTKINDWVSAHVFFLYEEDETELDVDEVTITMRNPEVCPGYVTAGKMYVPFGKFESNMISDPFTLELGETNETAVLAGLEAANFYASAYVFNGDINEIGEDDEINGFGINAGYVYEYDGIITDVGVGYINNIGDSDVVTDALPANKEIDDYVAGYALHAIVNMNPFTLIVEYVGAADDFKVGELPFDGSGAEPAAWNIELAMALELAEKEATLAFGYQGTDEALALGLPEARYMASLGIEVFEKTSLALELAHDEDYSEGDGGTGKDADILTIQLAVAF